MAMRALKPCAKPGCSALTAGRYCDAHRPEPRDSDAGRRDAPWRKWYYGKRFRRARDTFMAAHPNCALCGKPSTDLDHIKAHKGDAALFWDTANWQALCASCHSSKTAREDGAFGRGREKWERTAGDVGCNPPRRGKF